MISTQLINEYIEKLNLATKAYDEGHPIMSDLEWDNLYFYLLEMENKLHYYPQNSPTERVNYQVVNKLLKVRHNHDMLSLAKTKDLDEVKTFLNGKINLAMCKMDGLTCSLKYTNGKLVSAETRGDGTIGEDILHNALTLTSIPKRIKYKTDLVIDGEIICTIHDFKDFEEDYKNPRNFAAGSIRLLDSKECARRKLTFVAWDVIQGFEDNSVNDKLSLLDDMGFTTVPRLKGKETYTDQIIQQLKNSAVCLGYPIDGVVFKYDDVQYGEKLGKTEHHFKNAIAYKFYDETYATTLENIEWTMGRTGVLTPVAIFKPVDIDGSVVSRASLHNVSVMEETLGTPYSCQKLQIYKSNMIIPQIYSAEKQSPPEDSLIPEYFGFFSVAEECPICGSPTKIRENNGVKVLECTNPNCAGKLINRLDHFCGKKGLDMKGLSKATLEKLIDWGWINSTIDIFDLESHKIEWMKKDGFGEKSVSNILDSIEKGKKCELWQFLSAIGIPLIGARFAKVICSKEKTYAEIRKKVKDLYSFSDWEGFGPEIEKAILEFNYEEADRISELLDISNSLCRDLEEKEQSLKDINVVITGKLNHFSNRAALQSAIEDQGGKVVGSVSKKTNYLINNDTTSSSSKNLSAKKLNIPIVSEEDFINLFLTN